MLKTAKETFKTTTINNTWPVTPVAKIDQNRRSSDATIARLIFVKGPATPIIATPNSSYLTREELKGTGLAIKNGGKCDKISTIGKMIEV